MEIKINIDKKHFFIIVGVLFFLGGLVFVVGYGSDGPADFIGHSLEELEFGDIKLDSPGGGIVTFGYNNAPGGFAIRQASNGATTVKGKTQVLVQSTDSNNNGGSVIRFFTDNPSDGATGTLERMIIDENGRIRIGDPPFNPTSKLHVLGDVRSSRHIRADEVIGGQNVFVKYPPASEGVLLSVIQVSGTGCNTACANTGSACLVGMSSISGESFACTTINPNQDRCLCAGYQTSLPYT